MNANLIYNSYTNPLASEFRSLYKLKIERINLKIMDF